MIVFDEIILLYLDLVFKNCYAYLKRKTFNIIVSGPATIQPYFNLYTLVHYTLPFKSLVLINVFCFELVIVICHYY